MFSFLKGFSKVQPTRSAKQARRRILAKGFQPRLETLEDRTVPSAVFWTGMGHDWNWNNGMNWNLMTVPGPGDDAVINAAGTVLVGSAASVHSLNSMAGLSISGSLKMATNSQIYGPFGLSGSAEQVAGTLSLNNGGGISGPLQADSGATVNFAGGTFALSGTPWAGLGLFNISTATVSLTGDVMGPANLQLSAGTLTGSGTLDMPGTLTWLGGTMSGTGTTKIQSVALLDITGGASKTLDTRTLTNYGNIVWEGGTINTQNNPVISNQLNAVFDVRFDATQSGGGTINNSGTMQKSAGTGSAVLQAALNMLDGVFKVLSGKFEISTGTWSGGQLVGPGSLSVSQSLSITGGAKTLSGLNLIILPAATATWSGGDIVLDTAATIDNQGMFDAQGNFKIDGPVETLFSNEGKFRKMTGGGDGSTSIECPFWNIGTDAQSGVEAQVGLLDFFSPGISSSRYTAFEGASITFMGTGHSWRSNTVFQGAGWFHLPQTRVTVEAGQLVVNNGNFSLDLGGDVFGTGTADTDGQFTNNGFFKWNGGTIHNLRFNNGSAGRMDITASVTLDSSTLTSFGTINWLSEFDITLNSPNAFCQIINYGTFNDDGGHDMKGGAVAPPPAPPGQFGYGFVNGVNGPLTGVYNRTPGSAPTNIDVFFTNGGTVNLNMTILNFNGGYFGNGTINP